MDKENIIISIIIVLCIAAAVAAYGLTNSDNPVFSGLASMGGDDGGNGPGNGSITNSTNPSGNGGANGGSGSSGTGSGTGSNGGGSGGGSGSGSGSSVVPASTIKSDAWNHIGEEGCYPGTPYQSGGYWIVPIYNATGTQVDSIGYTLSGSYMGRM